MAKTCCALALQQLCEIDNINKHYGDVSGNNLQLFAFILQTLGNVAWQNVE